MYLLRSSTLSVEADYVYIQLWVVIMGPFLLGSQYCLLDWIFPWEVWYTIKGFDFPMTGDIDMMKASDYYVRFGR